MLTKKMEQAFNDQIKWEMYSGYMYLSMSAYFADKGLPGFAQWMKMQAQEELFHSMKFYDYVLERGGRVTLQAIDQPPSDWKSPLDVMEETLKHEQHVTSLINNLVDVAQQEKDHAAGIFLQWYVAEQVEEEDGVGEALGKLRLIGGDGAGLYMLDKEMATRAFTWPVSGE